MELPATLVFDFPTVAAISDLVASKRHSIASHGEPGPHAAADSAAGGPAAGMPAPWASRVVTGRPSAAGQGRPLAVLAAASRTGGDGAVLSLEGREAVGTVPFERWSLADVGNKVRGRNAAAACNLAVTAPYVFRAHRNCPADIELSAPAAS
jgi:hypothetical protein